MPKRKNVFGVVQHFVSNFSYSRCFYLLFREMVFRTKNVRIQITKRLSFISAFVAQTHPKKVTCPGDHKTTQNFCFTFYTSWNHEFFFIAWFLLVSPFWLGSVGIRVVSRMWRRQIIIICHRQAKVQTSTDLK